MPRVAIWNPASGSAPDEAELMKSLGDDVDLVETTADDPGHGQASAAVAAGAELIVACGGDGTVRACLDPLSDSATALAIIPLGTGNLLATNIGIPSGLDAAAGIGHGPKRKIDLARVNGEAFAVMAGSGFDALMISDASDALKAKLGSVAYVISGVKNLRTRLVRTTVEVNGEQWFVGRTSMVLVGNFGTISGGLEVFPNADACDGVLDVAVLSANTVREWVAVGWCLLRRIPPRLDLARRTQGRRITVIHDEPRIYELDGEPRDPVARLDFSVEPVAITIHHRSETEDNTPAAFAQDRRIEKGNRA